MLTNFTRYLCVSVSLSVACGRPDGSDGHGSDHPADPSSAATTDEPTSVATTDQPTTGATGDTATSGATDESTSGPQTATTVTAGAGFCGDGVVDPGETCDDGDADDSDECVSGCVAAICGDGLIWVAAEQCDDGNAVDDDGCTNACTLPACGDGVVQAGEGCDDGDDDNSDECPASCQTASCGDGFVHTGVEQCDDGNDADTDACLTGCLTAVCGDGVVQVGVEQCDDGDADDTDACLSNCFSATCGDGVVWAGQETCDDADVDNTDGCLANCARASSCAAIHAAYPELFDGVFMLDTGLGPFPVYCDMTHGGWTLIARFGNGDPRNWMLDDGQWWYQRTALAGEPLKWGGLYDAFSPAFFQVAADELRLTRSDDPTQTALLQTTSKCLGGATFRAHITGFGDFQNGQAWASDAVLGNCPAQLGGQWKATNGFMYAQCKGDIGAPNSISFWSDWSAGDGAVMMIGGGGDACGGADHGIGVTEANAANFKYDDLEDDFGTQGNDGTNNNLYALDLYVR